MDISELNCPQYVSFNSEYFRGEFCMDAEEDNSLLHGDQLCENDIQESINQENLFATEQLGDDTIQYKNDSVAESYSKIKNISTPGSSCKLRSTPYKLSKGSEEKQSDVEYHKFAKGLQSSASNSSVENLSSSSMQSKDCTPGQFPVKNTMLYPASKVIKCQVPKTTVPKPFKFKTDSRVKDKPKTLSSYSVEDFKAKLRQNKVSQKFVNHVTKVQPFHLTESKKRKREEYLPLAEQIAAFQKKTPERYHRTTQEGFKPPEHWSPKKICPTSPKLQAVKRQRVVTALSKEEKEEKEMNEYEFHAMPLDPNLFKKRVGRKKISKALTKARNIRLKTAERAAKQHKNMIPEEEKYKFRARPVPKSILNGPSVLREKPIIASTEPKSPAFATKARAEKWKTEKVMHETLPIAEVFKAHPVPSPHKPFIVKHEKKCTEVQPFTFDKYDKERLSQKQQKIMEEIEKENMNREFRANPMPSPSRSALPPVPKKLPTEPEPFNFLLESRSFKHHNSDMCMEEKHHFKANPATVLKKEPFVPEKSGKQNLEIREFDFKTEKRASERLRLREMQYMEECEKEELRKAQKALEEEQERIEIMKLRKAIVHKANPIRQFKQVEIKPSSKPLTEPVSPEFATEKRLKKH